MYIHKLANKHYILTFDQGEYWVNLNTKESPSLLTTGEVMELGEYDCDDESFRWSISEELQLAHLGGVTSLLRKLRK